MWNHIGYAGVDSGIIWIGDPCYVMGEDSSHGPKTWTDFCDKFDEDDDIDCDGHSQPLGSGIGLCVRTAHGDGVYQVYAKRDDCGRITEVKVVFDV